VVCVWPMTFASDDRPLSARAGHLVITCPGPSHRFQSPPADSQLSSQGHEERLAGSLSRSFRIPSGHIAQAVVPQNKSLGRDRSLSSAGTDHDDGTFEPFVEEPPRKMRTIGERLLWPNEEANFKISSAQRASRAIAPRRGLPSNQNLRRHGLAVSEVMDVAAAKDAIDRRGRRKAVVRSEAM